MAAHVRMITGMKWKQKMEQLHKRNQQGSAMIVAIIVSMVVVCFCLSLLLVSYALFQSSVRRVTQSQCQELAKTISIELEKELTTPAYKNYAQEITDLNSGNNRFWHYIRYNICQGSWPYYAGEEKTGHDAKAAYRYFNLNVSGGDAGTYAAMADDISVCIYWETDSEDLTEKNDVTLCIKVTCSKGDQKAAMLSKYALTSTDFQEDDSSGTLNPEMYEAVNPAKKDIDKSEYWKWTFMERE
ncbi:MAG: hypothetical protein J6C99_01100 [Lachnospiraceae bacterium]|nr:hypothetical protein [Lachnospiraceae bacterium]